MKTFIIILLLNCNVLIFGQQISGIVFEKNDKLPVESVNISIAAKKVGTISEKDGKYRLMINPEYHNDTIRFSCIGYHTYSVKVSDFMELNNGNVGLEKKINDLSGVVVSAKTIRKKNLIQNVWAWFTSCRPDGSDKNERKKEQKK